MQLHRTLAVSVAALALSVLSGISHAALGSESLAAYRKESLRALAECAQVFESDRRGMFSGPEHPRYPACIARKQGEVMERYMVAYASLRTWSTQSALIGYQEAFQVTLAGIEALPGESEVAYRHRQSALVHALTHAWSRFEVAE